MSAIERKGEFLGAVARINEERAAARGMVHELRTSSALLWEREIPREWRNAGFAQELIAVATETLEADPGRSLVFAQLALMISTSFPPETYPRPVQKQLEGSAWKEIGTAHRYRSEYEAALRAYAAALRCFEVEFALTHDAAITEFARAIVLADMGRYAEARESIEESVPLLLGFGDQRRVVQAMLLGGIIDQRQGRFSEARAAYETALREVGVDDLHTRAALYNNLGQVQAELGQFDEALMTLHQGRTVIAELNMPGEITRADWAIARAMLRAGNFDGAVPVLLHAREDFLSRRMPEEAGLAGLDLVEAFIATGKQDNARTLTESVLSEFRGAKLSERAITALAYLRDLPEAARANQAVRHVRLYIEQLRLEPDRPFIPA